MSIFHVTSQGLTTTMDNPSVFSLLLSVFSLSVFVWFACVRGWVEIPRKVSLVGHLRNCCCCWSPAHCHWLLHVSQCVQYVDNTWLSNAQTWCFSDPVQHRLLNMQYNLHFTLLKLLLSSHCRGDQRIRGRRRMWQAMESLATQASVGSVIKACTILTFYFQRWLSERRRDETLQMFWSVYDAQVVWWKRPSEFVRTAFDTWGKKHMDKKVMLKNALWIQ